MEDQFSAGEREWYRRTLCHADCRLRVPLVCATIAGTSRCMELRLVDAYWRERCQADLYARASGGPQ